MFLREEMTLEDEAEQLLREMEERINRCEVELFRRRSRPWSRPKASKFGSQGP